MTNTTINHGQSGTKESINLAIKMKGWLAHDNKLFDRTCPTCGGMYSSYETANCTKCGSELTFLTTKKGKPMAISEGTFFPCLNPNQKAEDLKNTQAKANGIEATYRFKLFSFADDNGVLAPPQAHGFCHKGSLVEFLTINHQPIYSLFTTNDGAAKVEVLFLIYENRGDYAKLIKKAEVHQHTVSYQVDANGNPIPIQPAYQNQQPQTANAGVGAQPTNNQDAINALSQRIAEISQTLAAMQATNTGQPVVQQNEVVEPTAGQGEVNPFSGAL